MGRKKAVRRENGQVVLCGFYHRYLNPDKTRNQAFDMFSGRIGQKTCRQWSD